MYNEALAKVINSEDFSTGGGTASALAGAMSAALIAMVARLSLKKDFGLTSAQYDEVISEAENLKKLLLEGATKDIEAFASVKAAYSLPKSSPEEKARRQLMIEKGFTAAAEIPGENAWFCKRALDLANLLVGKSNPAAGSDLEVALDLTVAALKGCLANIKVNLPAIKDSNTKKDFMNQIDQLESLLI